MPVCSFYHPPEGGCMPLNAHIFLAVKVGTFPINGPNMKVPRREKVFSEKAKNFDGMQLL